MEEQRIAKAHKLVVNNRKTSTVTGVLDVLSFDLNEIGDAHGERHGSSCQQTDRGKRRGRSVGQY